jgi:hypothetical protein
MKEEAMPGVRRGVGVTYSSYHKVHIFVVHPLLKLFLCTV